MTYLNQIRELESYTIKLAERGAPKEIVDEAICEMMVVTNKLLGNTNEYKEDLKE